MARGLCLVGVVWVCVCAGAAGAAVDSDSAWPRFRGPNGQGVAAEGAKPPVELGGGKHVAWATDVPPGHSSPVVAGGRLYVTGLEGARLVTVCLDAAGGRVLWSRAAPDVKPERVHPTGSPAASTPVTDGERVYAYFGSFGLVAYDRDGKELWKRPLPVPVTNGWGSASSPVLVGGRVVLVVDSDSGVSFIHAFDAKSGDEVWKTPRPLFKAGWSTPVLWAHDGTEDLVAAGAGRLVAYDPATGAQRWWVSGFPPQPISVPAVGGGMLFAGKGGIGDPGQGFTSELPKWDAMLKDYDADHDGAVAPDEFPADYGFQMRKEVAKDAPGNFLAMRDIARMIDGNKDGKVGRFEWALANTMMSAMEDVMLAIKGGGEGDVTETNVAWKGRRGVPEIPSPLFYRDRLYLLKNGGMVSCLDPATGKPVYRKRLGAGGQYAASPVAADGKIYAASEAGVVSVFRAGDELEVLAENDLGERIMATPAVVGDVIYVRTEKGVRAFREGLGKRE